MNPNVPQAVPQTATEILKTAASTLGERGKQYDPAGKQERSMTAIVAAFNAIYPSNLLTVHMGWQFMSLVKMVRGATKPHADSALDQVAYAALAAECVAEQLNQPESTKGRDQAVHYYVVLKDPALAAAQANFIMDKIAEGEIVQLTPEDVIRQREEVASQFVQPAALCEDEGCPHHGTPHVCVTSEVSYTSLQVSNQELAEELGKCQHWAGIQSQELKHLTDKLAAQQELLSVAQHNANFYFDKTNSCIAANESMTAKFQAERKANVAMHEEVTRLRGEVQELAALAEYRDKRNAELCAELETQRGKCIAQSSRSSELQTLVDNLRSSLAQATKECEATCIELAVSTAAMRSAQEQVTRLKAEATEARKRGSAGYNKQVAIQAELKQRNKKLEEKVQSLNNEVEAKVRELMSFMRHEAPCAHNTDEPKAPRPEYVDPYDSHGGQQPAPVHRLVGDRDPARGGLAYPNGKPL